MKIKTEIIHSIFIITCDGPSLDASLAREFLNAMGGFIQKNQMDILFDITGVNFVDSTGIGSIIRSLAEVDSNGQLILCGVNDRTLTLLKMAHLDGIIRHEATRDKALASIFWKEEEDTDTTIVEEETALKETREPVDINDLTVLLEPEKKRADNRKQTEIPKKERRQYRRIEKKQIMDEEFFIFCKNISTGKHHPGLVLNISSGGVLITTRSKLTIGDELLIEGRIGTQFKFKERAVSRSTSKQKHGLEFVDLSKETSDFLNRLTGAVDMTKSNRLRPN
jgi:anti-sigma B factor antagonist